MGTRLSPLGQVVKWLVIPASLAAVGYYLVGPRVTDRLPPSIKARVEAVSNKPSPITTSNSPAPESQPEATPPRSNYTEPQVDVTVSQLGSPQTKKKRHRRRHRKPSVETPTIAGPPAVPDTGGGSPMPPPDSTGGNG